ncbi:hypothetical protein CXG81DRAFT_28127 [Caulochytrium protostelioides]|uniref:glutamine--tRNA ligase n=1 Tax=Caulochytrium protostelioides TaxID=1555241 RepID=A0A4P9WZX3_9FUNG|nr:hypothetical protein CXG81DRAFT_28127 [Caulochytrium protostelioides]|eukprot:RKO99094.1 hypothetical protein CXG81DRAFT_28127 [Caulochytrium protostelioides]
MAAAHPDIDALTALFQKAGLSDSKTKETIANKRIAAQFEQVLTLAGAADADADAVPGKLGTLYYLLASGLTKQALPHVGFLTQAVARGDLTDADRISAAIKFCEAQPEAGAVDADAFRAACGVGVVVTPAEIEATVAKVVAQRLAELQTKRYAMVGLLLGACRRELRWADQLAVKQAVDAAVAHAIGPRGDLDDVKLQKKKQKEAKAKAAAAAPHAAPAATAPGIVELAQSIKFVQEGELARLHRPGENPQIRPELMIEHLKRTGGQVVTRFPPEPNGFLHVGHAKAININFAYAQAHNGITYLRYDDTNPEAEEEIYFTSILETVEWLGFKPHKVTYSSDYFPQLFELAVKLIEKDLAYACSCTGEEMHAMRGGDSRGSRTECVHRSRPVAESRAIFMDMKAGKYKEGEMTLRMKMDMQSPNPQFWDLVAYRVLNKPHHRTGATWRVYPTYDFTHCLVDSIEDITHSLCTTEFQMSRESYYWLVDAVEVYKPVQWEYGRLNIANAILSKRKLNTLVTQGHVLGWDDPRLLTLSAVRRRGFTPEAINAFVRDAGVTTAQTVLPPERLENYVRDHLNQVAPRLMAVLDPVQVVLTNLPADHYEPITVANHPRDPSMGTRVVPFTRTLFIDRADFRDAADPNFFRLVPDGVVGLLNVPHPIRCTRVVRTADGAIDFLEAAYLHDDAAAPKPKTWIQWVADAPEHGSPVPLEARLFSNLFHHANPFDAELVPNGWLSDVNADSRRVITGALSDVGMRAAAAKGSVNAAAAAKDVARFQFLRVGYFAIDPDSDIPNGQYVLNQIVSLKEDSKKD